MPLPSPEFLRLNTRSSSPSGETLQGSALTADKDHTQREGGERRTIPGTFGGQDQLLWDMKSGKQASPGDGATNACQLLCAEMGLAGPCWDPLGLLQDQCGLSG